MPSYPLLDSHIHLWPATALSPTDHTWMKPNHLLTRRHGISEYRASTSSSPFQPTGFVYVETDRHLPSLHPPSHSDEDLKKWARAPLEELDFLRRVVEGRKEHVDADGFDPSLDPSLVKGVVIWAPFLLESSVFDRYLGIARERLGDMAWGKVVGFRYLLQGRGVDGVKSAAGNAEFVRNVVKLAAMDGGKGKVFDVGADAHRDGVEAVEAVGELVANVRKAEGGEKVRFVMNHFCKPDLSTPSSSYSSFSRYKSAIESYAHDPNIYMKVSGALNEFEPTPTPADPIDIISTLGPYLDLVYSVFGAKRLMFGSDWPVLNVGGPKGEKEGEESNWSVWRSVVAKWMSEKDLSDEECAYIWSRSGVTAYGIEDFTARGSGGGEMSIGSSFLHSPPTCPVLLSVAPQPPLTMNPSPLLTGKTMAITGGVTGIGRAIVLGYLSHGARVAVNHLGDPTSAGQYKSLIEEAAAIFDGSVENKGKGRETAEDRLAEVPGDVGNPETGKKLIDEVVKRWGRLDVFVTNAGVCEFKEFLDISPDLWSNTLTTNLTGAFNTVQAAASVLSTQSPPGGSIIGISSISALVGGAQQAHYTPTKAGITSLMQSCACALGKYNIRCNALLPGTIKTQLNEKDLEDDTKRKYMEGRIPLGRTGVPADLAGPAIFLGSDLSAYVTGAQLLVDGGLFVNLQ
ncbi:unnamed protein product [Periconia digitata]|uniref:Amidohydrolase-related domain-containing protein n=1 Tax=Periconia digitata TaxID=1303443 RepID=A0A9W4UPN9_9PLEO|nr:unnamed protein product [Periconia digitata]